MLKRNFLALVPVFSIFIIGYTQDNVEQSYLRINQPLSLVNAFPNGVEKKPGMFGIPSYSHGASITGMIVYPQSSDLEGCFPIQKSHSVQPWPENGIIIVLVDRGNCTFVTKVRHCEEVGANAAIIVDNIDEAYIPYMANDGTGDSISIPSMLIHKHDGQLIKDATANGAVVVTMSWNLPHPDNIVEWEFWTSSNDYTGLGFKKIFKEVVQHLGSHASFVPRYFLLDGDTPGCTKSWLPCGSQCTNTGRYCAIDPEHDMEIGLDGAHVVRENLRQICLWQYLNRTNQQIKWWDYVVQFDSICSAKNETSWNQSCSQSIMESLNIDSQLVFQCVTDSGGSDENGGENSLLREALELKQTIGIFFMPTITINGVHYRGTLSCPSPIDASNCGVLSTICAGYKAGTEPSACLGSPGCPIGSQRDMCGICGGNGTFDGCNQCLEPNDPKFRANGKRDACGVCLNPEEEAWDQSCAGCDGIAGSGLTNDDCGVCNGTGRDICGSCVNGSKRITSLTGGWDVCGECLRFDSEKWDKTCEGCDGIPNSGKENDECGYCNGPGKDVCGRCLPIDSPNRITNDTGGWDDCGSCLKFTDRMWNKLCCDNGVTKDKCGNCYGYSDPRRVDKEGEDCSKEIKIQTDNGVHTSIWIIILIVIGAIVIAGTIIFFFMRARERHVKRDIDNLLKQYLPLDTQTLPLSAVDDEDSVNIIA